MIGHLWIWISVQSTLRFSLPDFRFPIFRISETENIVLYFNNVHLSNCSYFQIKKPRNWIEFNSDIFLISEIPNRNRKIGESEIGNWGNYLNKKLRPIFSISKIRDLTCKSAEVWFRNLRPCLVQQIAPFKIARRVKKNAMVQT